MKFKLLTFISTLLIVFNVSAQEAKFMVLGVKGDVSIGGENIHTGDMLLSGQEVTIKGTSPYLGLAYISGGTLELKKSGKYEVNTLESQLSQKENDLVSRYVDFIKDELTGSGEEASTQAKYGSVTRSLKKKPIYFYVPINSNAIKTEINLSWALKDGPSENGTYKIFIKDRKHHILLEDEVTGSEYTLNLNDAKLNEEKYLFYYVEDAKNNKIASDLYAFTVYNDGDTEETAKELEQLKSNETAIGKLILAKYYEDKGFIVNASTAYEQAISLSNGDEQYVKMYQNFQTRYGS
ncbi:hypothetical protein [Flammeovirga kamogawensis]|uniref:Tetratricopeptide repeat protein n=1 Tax=Flammeovirga kamogawensis TaxID=373891 RepID=A0ABX8GRB5_9BACT|nr:hypothetical protein [Flammeovirga kamogawensis]MBB6464007.1 hypothetical protein [Flammeovirga kamogawensis]QWG06115.1 hypothetical protein KM029_12205 [Flammeovirga kamogawensis]TRX67947.1 hypothetical protein EO216_07230 [Flammeovirga kamogawensis]